MDKQRYEMSMAIPKNLAKGIKLDGQELSEHDIFLMIKKLLPKRTPDNDYYEHRCVVMPEIVHELNKAREAFPTDYNSLHEAYGVIAEEIHELFIEIIQKEPDLKKVRKEAIQSIVVLLRLILELTPNEGKYGNTTNS